MLDEEKKAIKGLEWSQQQMRLGNLPDYDQGHYADIRIVLNLIEKKSKEIEELKGIKFENERTIELFIEGYKRIYKELDIKSLVMNENILINEIKENFTSNDKIKAKIEELEIEQESNREDLKIAIDNLLFQNIDKIGNRISINMSVRDILQSLLEKE